MGKHIYETLSNFNRHRAETWNDKNMMLFISVRNTSGCDVLGADVKKKSKSTGVKHEEREREWPIMPQRSLMLGQSCNTVSAAVSHSSAADIPFTGSFTLILSSSFCVSSSMRRMSSMVRSIHLSNQQKSCLWKLVNRRFSCL